VHGILKHEPGYVDHQYRQVVQNLYLCRLADADKWQNTELVYSGIDDLDSFVHVALVARILQRVHANAHVYDIHLEESGSRDHLIYVVYIRLMLSYVSIFFIYNVNFSINTNYSP
jgi:hypothetical protein